MLKYPNIDPVIFHIYGNFAIRWYSLAYIIGFFVCYIFFKRKNKILNIVDNKIFENLMTWIIIGVVLGARIFDCIFYNFEETISDPLSILRVYEGGMSFHGGAIGVFLVFCCFYKIYKINVLKILDLMLVVAPVALFCGRIANFINAELYGNITYTSPFRMIFPTDSAQQPRHPSQLYEAFAEGICLFSIMFLLYKKTNIIKFPGILTGVFGMLYSIARFVCEFFRSPEIDNLFGLTAGQWLSVFMFCCCLVFTIFKIIKNDIKFTFLLKNIKNKSLTKTL